MFLTRILADITALAVIVVILAVVRQVARRTWNLTPLRGRLARRLARVAVACQPAADRTATERLDEPTRRWEPAPTLPLRDLLVLLTPSGDRVEVHPGATIGRDPQATIRAEGVEVSRTHAIVTLTPAGWAVVDAGSTNGTYLNGRRVDDDGAPLAHGDVLTLGTSGPTFQVTLTPTHTPAVGNLR